jgi:hypothetical protein
MDRRAFLRAGAGAAALAAGAFSGCAAPATGQKAAAGGGTTGKGAGGKGTSTSGPAGGGTSTSPPTSSAPGPTSSTVAPAPPTAADWRAFGTKLDGSLALPSGPEFTTGAPLYNPVFDGLLPQGIAYCASPADAAASIAFARDHGMPFAVRAGGHSYAGYSTSTGLVLDVTRMNGIEVPAAGPATVGAGARLVDVYAACAGAGVAIPGGSCPTVGVAGLTLGGGLGVIGRKFGLTCDNMLSAEVVLADGRTVTASATANPDLYWALRGAGAGNFGVVTSFTFSTHPVGELGLFTLVWEWAAAARVVAAWQEFAPDAPDELWSNCLLLASQSTPTGPSPAARVTGVYVGSQSDLEAVLQPFLDAVGAQPFDRFVGSAGYRDTMLIEAGCEGDTVPQCHLPSEDPAGILTRSPFAAKSDYLSHPLSPSGIATLLAAVEARQVSPVLSGGGVALDASGGAINRVPADATAFVHRSDLATVQYSGNWVAGAPSAVAKANSAWLSTTWQSMRPFVSGQAYQNYIDAALPDWQSAYYGSNFERLTEVKAEYDPTDTFHFPQSIPLPS